MRLIVERALFASQSPQEALHLLQLLVTAAEDLQPHAVQTDPAYVPGTNNRQIDTWLAGRAPDEAVALRTVLASGNVLAAGAPRMPPLSDGGAPPWWHLAESYDVVVERRAASDWATLRLTLQDALTLLREPLHLVLENEWNDFAFVVHLAGPTLGPTLRRLKEAPARVHVHGGGGGAAKTWLRQLLQPPVSAEKWRRVLRAWVLFDQDAGEVDACQPSREASRMRDVCDQVRATFGGRLSWACLRRREIESYIPDAGLQAEATPARTAMVGHVIAWRAATAFERHAWAFDLKKGLRGDLHTNVTEATRRDLQDGKIQLGAGMLKAPFDALAPNEVAELESGFGNSKLNEAIASDSAPAWSARIPDEYDRGPAGQAPRAELIQALFDRI